MRLGFVTPWFGMEISGGAEAELRGLLLHLKDTEHDIEVLTTCVKDFTSDWNINYHKKGKTVERGITVRRFPVRKRDTEKFDEVNYKLMTYPDIPLTEEEEDIYCREMVNSDELYRYLSMNRDDYDLYVFIPYMFGTTYYGMQICLEKSVLIPCLHDESYIYLNKFKGVFSSIKGMIFHAVPEERLAQRTYDLSKVHTAVLGEGIDTEIDFSAERFRRKYHFDDPFILYAGRKDAGKRVDVLLHYFSEYKKRNHNSLKLVLIGGGTIQVPKLVEEDVMDLGFVDKQDKYDACSAASCLCQPSDHESFSLVIMESWLCRRPVLVNEACEVTKDFAIRSQGGLWFSDYYDFEGAVNYLQEHESESIIMGENGCSFVKNHFKWDVIVEKYLAFFEECK